jgi:hypothetical protein
VIRFPTALLLVAGSVSYRGKLLGQLPLGLVWVIPDSEMRRRRVPALYEVETRFRDEGWPS